MERTKESSACAREVVAILFRRDVVFDGEMEKTAPSFVSFVIFCVLYSAGIAATIVAQSQVFVTGLGLGEMAPRLKSLGSVPFYSFTSNAILCAV